MLVCELIVDQEQQRWSLVSVRADCLDSAPQNMKQMNFSQWHTHGKYNVNEVLKYWSMIGGNHCSSTAISYFVSCLVCDISLSGHFGNMIDLIIEALPICNNLSAIVILRIWFTWNKLWPCSQSLGYNGYFSLYSFISFILWNWGQIANLAGQLPRQRQRGPATHIMGLYCVILPEFLALLTSFDWCGESKAIYFISAAGD